MTTPGYAGKVLRENLTTKEVGSIAAFKYEAYEGWDPTTDFPKRNTLEELGLKNAADILQARIRLGLE